MQNKVPFAISQDILSFLPNEFKWVFLGMSLLRTSSILDYQDPIGVF